METCLKGMRQYPKYGMESFDIGHHSRKTGLAASWFKGIFGIPDGKGESCNIAPPFLLSGAVSVLDKSEITGKGAGRCLSMKPKAGASQF